MKIIVVGATGTIGKSVVKTLSGRHEILTVAHSVGDVKVDLAVPDSIQKMYSSIGEFDAVVCAAGVARFGMLVALTEVPRRLMFWLKGFYSPRSALARSRSIV